jgi:putative intracellular protease/amidase
MGFIPDLCCDVCARKAEIRTSEGLILRADQISIDLSAYDYLILPGGNGIRNLLTDPEFLSWISVDPDNTCVAAVCGGVLLAGAAGLLRGKRAVPAGDLSVSCGRKPDQLAGWKKRERCDQAPQAL